MDTVVLKFGGSSIADNIKLNIVANKIIDLYNKKNNIVVVVSAQGKTTDKLLKEAYELSNIPNERELDVLLSTGEQISISKLAILLQKLGYDAISLTGWQAGILTNNINQNASIQKIDTSRIEKESMPKCSIAIIFTRPVFTPYTYAEIRIFTDCTSSRQEKHNFRGVTTFVEG